MWCLVPLCYTNFTGRSAAAVDSSDSHPCHPRGAFTAYSEMPGTVLATKPTAKRRRKHQLCDELNSVDSRVIVKTPITQFKEGTERKLLEVF